MGQENRQRKLRIIGFTEKMQFFVEILAGTIPL